MKYYALIVMTLFLMPCQSALGRKKSRNNTSSMIMLSENSALNDRLNKLRREREMLIKQKEAAVQRRRDANYALWQENHALVWPQIKDMDEGEIDRHVKAAQDAQIALDKADAEIQNVDSRIDAIDQQIQSLKDQMTMA
jgi:hypothetical protein